ncbi:hypothetical protein MRBLMR1_001107 [Neorhizobium sp. LMR1-1-1.1]
MTKTVMIAHGSAAVQAARIIAMVAAEKKKKERQITLDGEFWFGRYKGKTGDYVARSNPRYILWVERNLTGVSICPKVRSLAVCVGMMQSEESADSYGSAGDWGFSAF